MYFETPVPLWSYHWAFDGWRFYCDGSSTFSVCVSSELLRDGREGRRPMAWHSTCDNKRSIALRANALRAYKGESSELIPPGPRSRVGTIQLNWVSSAYYPNVTYLLFGGRKHCAAVVGVGHQLNAMDDSTAAGALAESILQTGKAREMEAEPVPG